MQGQPVQYHSTILSLTTRRVQGKDWGGVSLRMLTVVLYTVRYVCKQGSGGAGLTGSMGKGIAAESFYITTTITNKLQPRCTNIAME